MTAYIRHCGRQLTLAGRECWRYWCSRSEASARPLVAFMRQDDLRSSPPPETLINLHRAITRINDVNAVHCSRDYSTGMVAVDTSECSTMRSYLQAEFQSSRSLPVSSSQVPQDRRDTDTYLKSRHEIAKNVSRKDKVEFIVKLLLDLKESKEAVYGALDAWVAWELTFPLVSLRKALIILEKQNQWHKVVQVIKWMLSKGQGTTMGTYKQMILALENDYRAEEAHKFWEKKVAYDLHSVPWKVCCLMISIYYRNNMLERLVKLFTGLEAFNRKPPDKHIVQQVANAYEMLGLLDEQKRVLEKYNDLFIKDLNVKAEKRRKNSGKKDKGTGFQKCTLWCAVDISPVSLAQHMHAEFDLCELFNIGIISDS